jgi:hypothetical protein
MHDSNHSTNPGSNEVILTSSLITITDQRAFGILFNQHGIYNEEIIDAGLKKFFLQHSNPSSKNANGSTYLALAMLNRFPTNVVQFLYDKYNITSVQSVEPLKRFQQVINSHTEDPKDLLKTCEEFMTNYRHNPDIIIIKKIGNSIQGSIQGLEWVSDIGLDVYMEDWFKNLKAPIQLEFFLLAVKKRYLDVDLVNNPIFRAMRQRKLELVDFLLNHSYFTKNERDE